MSGTQAQRYVHGHAEAVLRSHRSRTVDNSAAYLARYLRPGTSVLDIGCGPGTITADIAARVAPGEVIAIDPAADVVAAAARFVEESGVTNVRVLVGDVNAPQVAPGVDRRFDVVHAHQVLQHVADPVGALRRMGDLCAPGGVVGARDADYAAFTWFPQIPALDEWLALYRRLARASGGEPDAGRRLLSWARAADFSDVAASASVWCYATPESRTWWGGMWADRIVDSAIAAQAVSCGDATRTDLERMRAGWLEWAAADDGWFLVPHGEILCRP